MPTITPLQIASFCHSDTSFYAPIDDALNSVDSVSFPSVPAVPTANGTGGVVSLEVMREA